MTVSIINNYIAWWHQFINVVSVENVESFCMHSHVASVDIQMTRVDMEVNFLVEITQFL